jgi:hypothetical protein
MFDILADIFRALITGAIFLYLQSLKTIIECELGYAAREAAAQMEEGETS